MRSLQTHQVQAYVRRQLADALPDIVEKLVQEARTGSIPHAKILFVLSGIDKRDVPQARRSESLAALLLKELKRSPGAE